MFDSLCPHVTWLLVPVLAFASVLLAGCEDGSAPSGQSDSQAAAGDKSAAQPANKQADAGHGSNGRTIAIIETNFGTMKAELYPDQAPITVANFVNLARQGFYTDLPCHRMIPGFMVQCGKATDPAKAAALKPIKGEFSRTLKHTEGVLSMARTNEPDSATSQFFICFKPRTGSSHSFLDAKYAIFGKVTEGLDVLAKIEKVPVGPNPPMGGEQSLPSQPIILKSVKIEQLPAK